LPKTDSKSQLLTSKSGFMMSELYCIRWQRKYDRCTGHTGPLMTSTKHCQSPTENSMGQGNDSSQSLLISTPQQFILVIVLAASGRASWARHSNSHELFQILFFCLIRIKRVQSDAAQIDVLPDASRTWSLSVACATAGRVHCFGLQL
jgi:hypothetical protein